MKKSLACLTLIAAMLGTDALAATVKYENGTVKPNEVAGNVKTAMIVKASETGADILSEDIYYIDQAAKNSNLDIATGFAMKSGAPDGRYKLFLGRSAVTDLEAYTEVIDFEITALPPDIEMEALANSVSENEDGTFNMGFVCEGIELGKYKWLVFTLGTGENQLTLGYSVEKLGTAVSGGLVDLGIRLNNIENEYRGAVKLGFTAEEHTYTEENE